MRWDGDSSGTFYILDQTLLPAEEREIPLNSVPEVADAIRRLAVRGAPAIGIAAAYGLVVAARELPDDTPMEDALRSLDEATTQLGATRPTAVNLKWALNRMAPRWRSGACTSLPALREALLEEARAIHREDREACEAMAQNAAYLVRDGGTYLTHCNAGSLATGGIGTALGVFHHAARQGKRITVYADETRPLLQGARLTSWELLRAGIEVVLICDSAAASTLLYGSVDAVFVGADRIAANGDIANKLGTLSVALAAARRGVPFYVVAPSSTFDLNLASGSEIPIEDRSPAEVTDGFAARTTPDGVKVKNPAFDVTPADLITGIVTERGVILSPETSTVAAILLS